MWSPPGTTTGRERGVVVHDVGEVEDLTAGVGVGDGMCDALAVGELVQEDRSRVVRDLRRRDGIEVEHRLWIEVVDRVRERFVAVRKVRVMAERGRELGAVVVVTWDQAGRDVDRIEQLAQQSGARRGDVHVRQLGDEHGSLLAE